MKETLEVTVQMAGLLGRKDILSHKGIFCLHRTPTDQAVLVRGGLLAR